jgi:hypothetical protein
MGVYTRPSIVTNGLVLNLDAANIKSYPTTGTTWTDLSGNSNTGTLTLGPTFSKDGGGSIVFDGSDDLLSINDSESFTLTNKDFCFDFWINFTSLLNNRTIISQYNVSGLAPIWIGRVGSSLTVYASSDGVNWNVLNNQLGFTVTSDQWLNIVLTRSGNVWASYLNGVQKSTLTASGVLYNSTNNLIFASRVVSGDGYLSCKLSNLKLYVGKSLTAPEITQNYNALKSRFNLR